MSIIHIAADAAARDDDDDDEYHACWSWRRCSLRYLWTVNQPTSYPVHDAGPAAWLGPTWRLYGCQYSFIKHVLQPLLQTALCNSFSIMFQTNFLKQESCAVAKMTAQWALYMGALKIFGTPWLRPWLLFPTFFMGFFGSTLWMFLLNLKSVALSVPEIIGRGVATGGISVFIPPPQIKSAQVNFLWGINDARTAIQQFYPPPNKNFYTPKTNFWLRRW